MRFSAKEVDEAVRELVRKGWKITRNGKHAKAEHPTGGFVTISCSPRDGTCEANYLRQRVARIERSKK